MTISETTDRVQQIGREFLKPFPEGWSETLWSHDMGWTCTAVHREGFRMENWPERRSFEVHAKGATPDEARRLCREEAERKSRAEHKGDSNADNQV